MFSAPSDKALKTNVMQQSAPLRHTVFANDVQLIRLIFGHGLSFVKANSRLREKSLA